MKKLLITLPFFITACHTNKHKPDNADYKMVIWANQNSEDRSTIVLTDIDSIIKKIPSSKYVVLKVTKTRRPVRKPKKTFSNSECKVTSINQKGGITAQTIVNNY